MALGHCKENAGASYSILGIFKSVRKRIYPNQAATSTPRKTRTVKRSERAEQAGTVGRSCTGRFRGAGTRERPVGMSRK